MVEKILVFLPSSVAAFSRSIRLESLTPGEDSGNLESTKNFQFWKDQKIFCSEMQSKEHLSTLYCLLHTSIGHAKC